MWPVISLKSTIQALQDVLQTIMMAVLFILPEQMQLCPIQSSCKTGLIRKAAVGVQLILQETTQNY